jgi:hypothetical protein
MVVRATTSGVVEAARSPASAIQPVSPRAVNDA